MFDSRKDIDELRLWESIEVLENLIPEIKITEPKISVFVSSSQAVLQQILRVRQFELWLFTTDFVARLRNLEAAVGSYTELLRKYISVSDPREADLVAVTASLETLIDETRRAGILEIKIKQGTQTEKIIRDYTNAAKLGLEELGKRESEYLATIDNLQIELQKINSEIAQNRNTVSETIKAKDDFILELKTENKEFLHEEVNKATALVAEKLHSAEGNVEEIQKLALDSKKLADKVYQKTVSQEYGQYAIRQSIVAGIYSLVTVIAGVATAILNWKLAHEFKDNSSQISNLKIFGSVASFAVFGFLAAETSGYRHQARDAKRTQLDLNSVDTAVTKLDEVDGQKLRLTVIQETFRRPRPAITRWSDGLFARKN